VGAPDKPVGAADSRRPPLRRRLLRWGLLLLGNLAILLVGLVILDVVATKLDLVALRATMNGHPVVGFASNTVVFGEEATHAANHDVLTVAILGDSHHQYVPALSETHQSVVLHRLLDEAGVPNRIVSLGTPRYAPIQELVAYETLIKPDYDVDVVIFLLYAGNDFAETLRDDDRPHAERDAAGRPLIAGPRWLLQRVPGERYTDWPQDSRLLYLLNAATPSNLVLKLVAADRGMDIFDASLGSRFEYIANLWRFKDNRLGYPGAVPAQFLYQYYLYTEYPEIFSREAAWRIEYFFAEFRRLNPSTTAYVFFLPSAPAIDALPELDRRVLGDILQRSGMQQLDFADLEGRMFGLVEGALQESGANFGLVDLSPVLRAANAADGHQDFYDEPTIHIDTKARRVVAEEMARVLLYTTSRSTSATRATSSRPISANIGSDRM